MNDKRQLAAMGEHLAEQQQPMCLQKRAEQLEALLREAREMMDNQPRGFSGMMRRIDDALDGRQVVQCEPFAWSYEWASCVTTDGPQNFKAVIEREAPPQWAIDEGQARKIAPLYTVTTTHQSAPEDWQLVPVEPTGDMLEMAEEAISATSGLPEVWAEMLAAAPKFGGDDA